MKCSKLKGTFDAYVWLNELAEKKLRFMTELTKEEIGCLCLVEKNKIVAGDDITLEYIITDAFIVEQEVNGGTCELSPKGVAKLYGSLGKKADNLLCWYHSHHNMSTSPSSQDNEMFTALAENTETFYIRIIGNKKGDFNVSIIDKEENLKLDDVSVYIDDVKDEIKDFIKAEIKEKVSIKKYNTSVNKTHTKTSSSNLFTDTYLTDIELPSKYDSINLTDDDLKRICKDYKLSSYSTYGYYNDREWLKENDKEYSIEEHCVALFSSGTYRLTDDVVLKGVKVNIGDKITDYLTSWGAL